MMKSHMAILKIIAVLLAVFAIVILLFYCGILLVYKRDYKEFIEIKASEYGISPSLIHAMIFVESGYDQNAVSSAGAIGLMQIMPSTASWCVSNIDELQWDEQKLYESEYNIAIGIYYISYLLKSFDLTDALCAYNAGEGNVRAWREVSSDYIPFSETANYVKKVAFAQKVYDFIL